MSGDGSRPAGAPAALPLLFVALSGSGFVGARLGLPHAEPFIFLGLRFALAALILAVIARALRAPWPRDLRETLHIGVAGLLGIAVFSASVFYSLALGVPPAVSALIIALHPILVALGAGPLLGERVSPRQWLGLLLGLAGVYLVLRGRLLVDPAYLDAALLSVLGLVGMSAGNLYQKAYCPRMNALTGSTVQHALCALPMFAGAALFESGTVEWSGEFVVALLWMAVPVSVGAVTLLGLLIQRGEVSRVASVFYLMPVSTAITAYLLFGQTIEAAAFGGIALAAAGVLLAVLKPASRSPAGGAAAPVRAELS
ncbi:MAG: DMT family transporter [Rhodocyclales bacterium]|nr:DMT family transporter [Rhodocyclales bacterium]